MSEFERLIWGIIDSEYEHCFHTDQYEFVQNTGVTPFIGFYNIFQRLTSIKSENELYADYGNYLSNYILSTSEALLVREKVHRCILKPQNYIQLIFKEKDL